MRAATQASRISYLTILAALLATSTLSSQQLAEERQRFLPSLGRVKKVALDLFPVAKPMGLVFKQEIVESTATSLALHFAVVRPGTSWGIQILDQAGKVRWAASDTEVDEGDFWSDEVTGRKVTVELYSARTDNPLQLRIDKLAVGKTKVVPVSISSDGNNEMRPIGGQDDWIVALGRSVARLRFVGDDGGLYFCTAFLVSAELMMTNQHCIATDSERKSAKVDFDFDAAAAKPSTTRLRELADWDEDLDYSIVRLREPAVGRAPLMLGRDRPPLGSQLLIIEHPEGEPKQVSIAGCLVAAVDTPGRRRPGTDFEHDCDTLSGSSGSPVVLFGSRRVLGLHHLGWNEASASSFNRAVQMDLILDDLKPELLTEIGLAN